MKKLLYIILFSGILFSWGCETLDLDEELHSSFAASNYYQTVDHLQTQALGMYDFWHCVIEWWMYEITELQSMYAGNTGYQKQLALYDVSSNSWHFGSSTWQGTWGLFYECINKANTQIKYGPGTPVDQTIIDQHVAEAKFMRAWSYFTLTRLYGELPIYTEPSETLEDEVIFKKPSPISEIYDLIVSDLIYAVENMPATKWDDSPSGRALAPAAYSLLGEVYLTMAGKPLEAGDTYYTKAADILEELIENESAYNIGLLDDWKSIFALENESNEEILFGLRATDVQFAGSVAPFSASPPGTKEFAANGGYRWTFRPAMLDLYEPQDIRRKDGFIWEYVDLNGDTIHYIPDSTNVPRQYGGENGICMTKFIDGESSKNVVHKLDKVFIRYAEVFLMAAEARCEEGSLALAREHLNVIRRRVNASEITTNDQSELRQIIREERTRELYGEYNAIYDIRRWGTGEVNFNNHTVKERYFPGYTWSENFNRWPYPSYEVSTNVNLDQNPGWD